MDELLNRITQHFTPPELIEFLGIGFEDLFDSNEIMQAVMDNLDGIREEIGIEE